MSKYDPLRCHLAETLVGEVILTFDEIERLVGPLPASADRPQFWANTRRTQPRPQRDAWRNAGFDAFLLAGLRRVRFVRAGASTSGPSSVRAVTPPAPVKPPLTVEALIAGGFELANNWTLGEDGRLALAQPLPSASGVYAFVQDGSALYVGIASTGFRKRLGFYIRPGSTQRTSQRLNGKLVEVLTHGAEIAIFTASPPSMIWSGWNIDVAAGLEVALIRQFDVPWNMRGA